MPMPQFLKDKIPSGKTDQAPDTSEGESDKTVLDDAEIAGVLEGSEGESEIEEDAGPDEGEPTTENDLQDDPASDDGETDEAPEEGEEQAEEEQAEEAPAEKPDAKDAVIEELRKQNALLLSLVDPKTLQQNAPPPPQDQKPKKPPIPPHVLRLALRGGEKAEIERIPPAQWAEAQATVEGFFEQDLRYFQDPDARYAEQVQPQVLQDFFKLAQPLIDDYHQRKSESRIQKQLLAVKDPQVRSRAWQLYQSAPGARSTSWDERGAALELSIKAAEGESLRRAAAERKQKRTAGKAQAKASGGGTLKAAPKAAGAQGKAGEIPDIQPGEDLVEFYNRVQQTMLAKKNNK